MSASAVSYVFPLSTKEYTLAIAHCSFGNLLDKGTAARLGFFSKLPIVRTLVGFDL